MERKETYVIAAAIQPEVLSAIDLVVGDSTSAYLRALRRAGVPATTIRGRAHRQHTPYETTIVGVSRADAERIQRFRSRHQDPLVTIVDHRAVTLSGVASD